MDALSSFARVVHVVLLALWLGASVFFAAVLAPAAFELLPSHELAGTLITATLSQLDLFGLICGPVLLVTLLLGWMGLGVRLRLRVLFTFLMTIAVAASGRFLTPEMVRLRAAMGRKIEDVAATDPLKIEFSRLHTVSTSLLLLHLVLAFILIVLAVSASAPKKKYGSGIEL